MYTGFVDATSCPVATLVVVYCAPFMYNDNVEVAELYVATMKYHWFAASAGCAPGVHPPYPFPGCSEEYLNLIITAGKRAEPERGKGGCPLLGNSSTHKSRADRMDIVPSAHGSLRREA